MNIAFTNLCRSKLCFDQFTPLMISQRYSKDMFPEEKRRIKASKFHEELLGKGVMLPQLE